MTLAEYYTIIFNMTQHHNYSVTDLESMYPFERDIYYGMLVDLIKEQQKEHQESF